MTITANLGQAASLTRFKSAHAHKGIYRRALGEIQAGRKRTHWMWFVFPQLRALGRSDIAQFYGIADRAEALAYLDDPTLRLRLGECATGILAHDRLILTYPDDQKLRSCMTLFSKVAADPALPIAVLDKFYGGKPDQLTLDVLDGKTITLPPSRNVAVQPLLPAFPGLGRETPDEFDPWPRARVEAFARGCGLSGAALRLMVGAWMADQDRSYDAGWNAHADENRERPQPRSR